MAKPDLQDQFSKETNEEQEPSTNLKGTLTSVMFLGGFIIVSWLGVWLLYLYR